MRRADNLGVGQVILLTRRKARLGDGSAGGSEEQCRSHCEKLMVQELEWVGEYPGYLMMKLEAR